MIQSEKEIKNRKNESLGEHGYSVIKKRSSGRHAADLLGKRCGNMTVIEKTDERFNGNVVWLCKCDCGNTFAASTQRIIHKNLSHCFDEKCPYKDETVPQTKQETHRQRKGGMDDITGKRFGRLTVVEKTGVRMGRNLEWYCQCECGKQMKCYAYALLDGKVTECKSCQRGI